MKRNLRLAAVFSLAFAAPAATIRVDPASSAAFAGSTIDLNVQVTDVQDLYAYQFDIDFNAAILFAGTVSEGSFLAGGGSTLFLPGTVNNALGTITLTANTLLGAVPGVDGSGPLTRIRFNALAAGTTPITISNVILLNSAADDTPATIQNGTVRVAIPEPNSAVLFGSAIGLACLLGSRRRSAKSG